MRKTTWHTAVDWDGIWKIEMPSTDIGSITIEHLASRGVPAGAIHIKLNDHVRTYRLCESDELHDTSMEFKNRSLTHKALVDVMETLYNMADDDIANLVAQLFGVGIRYPYTPRPSIYRIVA